MNNKPGKSVSKRKPLSKKVRFEVFKRDLFKCQYCGATPPGAVLEIDHIQAVADGGDNGQDNLVTACFDCNRGKAAISLTVAPEALSEKAARIAEAEEQLAGYRAILQAQSNRQDDDIWEIVGELFNASETTKARYGSISRFLERLPFGIVLAYAKITKINQPNLGKERTFKYFCWLCWNEIREREEGEV